MFRSDQRLFLIYWAGTVIERVAHHFLPVFMSNEALKVILKTVLDVTNNSLLMSDFQKLPRKWGN